MEEPRAEINSYHGRNLYNMDETALFWNSMPDTTLATCPQIGKRESKTVYLWYFAATLTAVTSLIHGSLVRRLIHGVLVETRCTYEASMSVGGITRRHG